MMAKDARMQKLIESKIKPIFDNFNKAAQEMSLSLNDLNFKLDKKRRQQAENVVCESLKKAKSM